MRKDTVKVLAAFVDYRSKTDDLWTGADDDEEFEAAVVLEGYVAIVCFEFHYFLKDIAIIKFLYTFATYKFIAKD